MQVRPHINKWLNNYNVFECNIFVTIENVFVDLSCALKLQQFHRTGVLFFSHNFISVGFVSIFGSVSLFYCLHCGIVGTLNSVVTFFFKSILTFTWNRKKKHEHFGQSMTGNANVKKHEHASLSDERICVFSCTEILCELFLLIKKPMTMNHANEHRQIRN